MKKMVCQFSKEFKQQILSIKTEGIRKQIPNMLTLSRALAPLIVIPTILFGRLDVAITELIIFALTDCFDGILARKFDCVTDFGIKLDAICDKFFALAVLIPTVIKHPPLIINLILEICISYINMLSEFKGNQPKSNIIGKVKTVFLSFTLILSYVETVNEIYILMMSIMTSMLQIWAFVKYQETDISKEKEKKQ